MNEDPFKRLLEAAREQAQELRRLTALLNGMVEQTRLEIQAAQSTATPRGRATF